MVGETKPMCGIVMPISAIDGCDEAHWLDVLSIISDAATKSGFTPNIVSNSDDVGVIQKRIVQNIYENEMVVCDVSGKNPNVMFELGMRLAFDKPTIIIKDDKTSYSFDTSPIEHITYPRDLRFAKIIDFKEKLASKITATFNKSKNDGSYSPFLKHFGDFKVAKIDTKEVSGQDFIIEELRMMRFLVERLNSKNNNPPTGIQFTDDNTITVQSKYSIYADEERAATMFLDIPSVLGVRISQDINGATTVFIRTNPNLSLDEKRRLKGRAKQIVQDLEKLGNFVE